MQATITKIKTLENFLNKHGDDAYIANTLAKMLDYKIQQYDKDIAALQEDLCVFEKKYAMTSAEFFSKFQKGGLGDEMDFIEWSALYQMRQNLLEKKEELTSAK
ncbi:MAG: hypothetical protein ACREOI_14845 [bacterium]